MSPVDMAEFILLGLCLWVVTSVFLIYYCVIANDRPDGIFRRETSRETNPSEVIELTEELS